MKTYDCIIIGCGPAGISSAIYLKRDGINVAMYEGSAPGGAIVNTEVINNYPGYQSISGADLAINMFNSVLELGIDVYYESVVKIEKQDNLFKVNNTLAKYIIIATGTKVKTLGIPNEEKYFYRGISWCATCDGFLHKDKDVAVIGGGDSALSSAITLARYCKLVYLIHRRDAFRAKESLINDVKSLSNIKLILSSTITDFIGMSQLESIEVTNLVTNKKEILPISCLFEEIGRTPNSNLIDGLALDNNGFIMVNENYETSIDGIYAVGDVISKQVRQIVTATSDGTICAINVSKRVK